MAKTKSIVRLRGNLGDINFFERNGKSFARMSTTLSKDRIMRDPNFKRTRENMAEFGGSAKVGKAMRLGLARVLGTFADNSISGRLTGLFKQVNTKGSGIRGRRKFELLANKHILEGFEFQQGLSLPSIFKADYELTTAAARDSATITIPDFNAGNEISAPSGATHFRLILNISTLSDYEWNVATGRYEPVSPSLNSLKSLTASAEIPLSGMVGSDTLLTASLPAGTAMTSDSILIASFGIEFYQEINTELYLLATDNVMRLVGIV